VKILFDECVDRRFAREFPEHEVRTVPQMGWAGITNGELMTLASGNFDVFLTVDRNLSYQQDVSKFDIAVLVLHAVSNRYDDLQPFGNLVRESLESAKKGTTSVLSNS
jgi:hypothetical protein